VQILAFALDRLRPTGPGNVELAFAHHISRIDAAGNCV
jgi:hypothetical protein